MYPWWKKNRKFEEAHQETLIVISKQRYIAFQKSKVSSRTSSTFLFSPYFNVSVPYLYAFIYFWGSA